MQSKLKAGVSRTFNHRNQFEATCSLSLRHTYAMMWKRLKESMTSFKWKNSPPKPGHSYQSTNAEIIADCFTHGVCSIPVIQASRRVVEESVNPAQRMSSSIFSITMSLLFVTSTSFHVVTLLGYQKTSALRYYLHIADKSAIFFYVAASFTPWFTLCEDGCLQYHLRWLVWVLAALGCWYSFHFNDKYKRLEAVLYFTFCLVPTAMFIVTSPPKGGISEMCCCGAFYIIGFFFFKSDGIVPFAHAIWHLFVVGGATMYLHAIQTHLIGCRHLETEAESSHLPHCDQQNAVLTS